MIRFTVPDMSCNHCVQTITTAVRGVDGAAGLQFDLATHQVQIDSAQPAAVFAQALSDHGYPPSAAAAAAPSSPSSTHP